MGEIFLNGRKAADWEAAALERARQCELERDMRVLDGLLTGEQRPETVSRPVTDITREFS